MIRPMQAAHFSGIMGAPAPNVTITQQGPVPNFNPHEVGAITQQGPVPNFNPHEVGTLSCFFDFKRMYSFSDNFDFENKNSA